MKRSLVLALLTLGLVLAFGSVAMAKVDVTVDPWGSFEVGVPVKDNLVAVVGFDFWSDHETFTAYTAEESSDTYSRWALLVGGRYYFNGTSSVKPYGFGKFIFMDHSDDYYDNVETEWSANAGLGLEKEISDDFSLVGELGVWFDYTKDDDDDTELITSTDASIGLKFYL